MKMPCQCPISWSITLFRMPMLRGWTDTVVKVIKHLLQANEGNWSNLERPQGGVKKPKGCIIGHIKKVSTSPTCLITYIKISVFENTYSIYSLMKNSNSTVIFMVSLHALKGKSSSLPGLRSGLWAWKCCQQHRNIT